MNPIVASGAASLAGVLINKVSGHSSSPSGNVLLEPKEFERALNKAGGSRDRQSVQHQAADLRQKLMQRPEVEAAIYSQPPGSVTGLELRADGSLSLRTNAGPVAVQMGSATRELAQAVYSASAVQAVGGGGAANGAPQAPLLLPLQMVQGAALR
jgi:hypothetical protein